MVTRLGASLPVRGDSGPGGGQGGECLSPGEHTGRAEGELVTQGA